MLRKETCSICEKEFTDGCISKSKIEEMQSTIDSLKSNTEALKTMIRFLSAELKFHKYGMY